MGNAITDTISPVGEDWTYTLEQPIGSYDIYLEARDTAGNRTLFGPFDVEVVSVAGNSDPIAVDDTAETFVNETVIIDVVSNDSDGDDDSLYVYGPSLTQPVHGSVVISGNQIVYSPTVSFIGTETFSYLATDQLTLSGLATVSVTVKEIPNVAPTVSAGDDVTITLPADASLSGTVSDDGRPTDPGTTTVSWSKVSGPGTVTFANSSATSTTASFSAPVCTPCA